MIGLLCSFVIGVFSIQRDTVPLIVSVVFVRVGSSKHINEFVRRTIRTIFI